jgi:trehalose 6-phosphate synthase/phosphatase
VRENRVLTFSLLFSRYVVCQSEKKQSAMIISEFTGCSRSLSSAFRVNPWASEEVATAIQSALALSEKDRVRKLARDLKYVQSHTGDVWASHIVTELEKVAREDAKDLFAIGLGLDLKIGALGAEFSRLQAPLLKKSYLACQRRLLLLNCDSLFDQNPSAVTEVRE